jgi:polysaccharide export outer membrane protein
MRAYDGSGRHPSALWLVLCLASLGVGYAGAQEVASVEIEAIALREDDSRSLIELATEGRVECTAGYSSNGDLQVRIANSTPAPGLVRDLIGDQLVSRVQVVAESERGGTALRISTRSTAGYTVLVSDDGVQIMLRPIGESAVDESAGAAAASSATEATAPVEAPALDQTRKVLLTIGSGDLLEVDVLGVDELSRTVRVLSDGTITLPPMGNFPIAGLSIKEAELRIAELLSDQQLVNDPQVSVFVTETVGGGVSVQGAVTKPGVYQLFGRNTLIEVVGQAGGLTRDAGGRRLVLREMANGEQETIDIDVDRLVEEGDASVNITLAPGDIVVVPRGRQLKVYVTGAVRRPGAVDYSSTEGITVLQAITAAGGPTERANLKKVTVRRRNADGTEQSIKLNVKKIQSGKESDLPLERNDTVVVGEWLL